tara:strand:+ start:256 stop:561 length:306 start_codon:yes stop_codon:yes gene_type:complete
MTFSKGTKEQLEKQWADLEADKQEALARIRAKENKIEKCDHALDRHEFWIEFHEVCECGEDGDIINVYNVGATTSKTPLTKKEIDHLTKQFIKTLKGLNNE